MSLAISAYDACACNLVRRRTADGTRMSGGVASSSSSSVVLDDSISLSSPDVCGVVVWDVDVRVGVMMGSEAGSM